MPRALWKGAINFGLIHIPVKMYKATSAKDIRFRELHAEDASPLKQKKVCAFDGEEVPREEVVKGYEIAPDRFVIIQKEELEALQASEPHTITIENFVELEQVDPLYFENSYYVVPEKGAAKAYSLLLAAMEEAGKAAIARVVLRQKQHLCLLRPSGQAIAMSTLYYADEVVSQEKLEGLPEDVKPEPRELTMARQLIESLTEEFRPERYRDTYRDKVLAMIEAKAQGQQWRAPEPQKEAATVIDLVSALQASLDAAKKPGRKTPAGARAGSKTTKKRTAA